MPELRDWKNWFDAYEDPDSPLSRRLRAVQGGIARALDEAPAGPVRVLSLCAGEGRDLIPVLAAHPRRDDVSARLVEFDPVIAQKARVAAAAAGLDAHVEVVVGDAADLTHYSDMAPAYLVLLCGIFGNISDEDIRATVGHAAALTARGGTVLWTRHRREPDLVPTIHEWFAAAGFAPVWEYSGDASDAIHVAGQRQERDAAELELSEKAFTFIKYVK